MGKIIPNKGSTARDHLANERTFLAWVRTALGLVGLGVVLERFAAAEPKDAPWATLGGALLIGAGGLLLTYGFGRYVMVAQRLEHGEFPVARRGPLTVAVGASALVLTALVYVLR